jgi:hypothetical protein
MSKTYDHGTRYIILGAMRMGAESIRRFIETRTIREDFNEHGIAESFTITTASGLRYRVSVDQLDDDSD